MPLQCEIVTQDRVLYEGPADSIQAPGTIGEMGILPNHAPLLTTLAYGVVRVRNGSEQWAFTVAGGVMEVRPETVIVLADVGENVEEIDLARAEAARERAEALLQQGAADTGQYLALEAALRRSKLRLEAARRYGKGRKPGFPGSVAGKGE